MNLKKYNWKKLNKSELFRKRQRACEQVIAMKHKPNVFFFMLLQTLRSAYWCKQLALQCLAEDVSIERWQVIFQRLQKNEIRLECYYEAAIAPPRLFLLGCDVPEIALYWMMPTDPQEAVSIELSANYALIRLLEEKPWHMQCQVHPSTLLLFDLKEEYALLPKQKEFLCQVILLALLRGIRLLTPTPEEWSHPLLKSTYARMDSLLPKLLDH